MKIEVIKNGELTGKARLSVAGHGYLFLEVELNKKISTIEGPVNDWRTARLEDIKILDLSQGEK